ncbi:MAG TPA: MFS transporter, partial [Planctomycetia bacterium]|nr:MFS transporter [Planctomycetia bacterium]
MIVSPPGAGPNAARYRVLALVCVLSMITYVDRVSFGAAAPDLAAALSLSGTSDLKWAFTAFAIAYAVFEIPTGWMGDRWGPRSTLLRIVGWWSLCTALTGLVGMRIGDVVLGGLGTLICLRFLFGAGEAGAYPIITRALHNWFPASERPFAQGWVWMCGRLAGGLTPLLWMALVVGTSWTP